MRRLRLPVLHLMATNKLRFTSASVLPASHDWAKQNMICKVMGEYFIWPKRKQDLFQSEDSRYWKMSAEYFIESKSCKPGMIFSVLSGFSDLPKNSSPFYKRNPKPHDNHNPWNIKLKVKSILDLQILDSFRFLFLSIKNQRLTSRFV